MVVMVWVQIGYPVVIFMAALQRVDPELYEAAELDGAGWFQRFRCITVSAASGPRSSSSTLTCTIAALKVFGPIYALTGGGPGTATIVPCYYSYLKFFQSRRSATAPTIATVLTIVIVLVAIGFIRLQVRPSVRRDALMPRPRSTDAERDLAAEPPTCRRSRSPMRQRPLIVEPECVARAQQGAARAQSGRTGSWLASRSSSASLVAVPFILILINAFKSPADYTTSGPLCCRPSSTSTAS